MYSKEIRGCGQNQGLWLSKPRCTPQAANRVTVKDQDWVATRQSKRATPFAKLPVHTPRNVPHVDITIPGYDPPGVEMENISQLGSVLVWWYLMMAGDIFSHQLDGGFEIQWIQARTVLLTPPKEVSSLDPTLSRLRNVRQGIGQTYVKWEEIRSCAHRPPAWLRR